MTFRQVRHGREAWHLAPSIRRQALCGAKPKDQHRIWRNRLPLDKVTQGRCMTCWSLFTKDLVWAT